MEATEEEAATVAMAAKAAQARTRHARLLVGMEDLAETAARADVAATAAKAAMVGWCA